MSKIIPIFLEAVLAFLLVYTSVADIEHLTTQESKPSSYHVELATNTTQKLPIDSTKYEAVEITQSDSNRQHTISISPTTVNISRHKTSTFSIEQHLDPMPDDRNTLILRYWPIGFAVTGQMQCQSYDNVILVWTWSSIFYGDQNVNLNAQIDCSKYQTYPGQYTCPNQYGTVSTATILQTRRNNNTMLGGACATQEGTQARAVFKADFEEEHYDTEDYPHYDIGFNTDNPTGIILPLTENNQLTYLYITVTGKQSDQSTAKIHINPISDLSQKGKKHGWTIFSITVKLAAALYFILACIIKLFCMFRGSCQNQ